MVKRITQCRPNAVRRIGRPRLRLEDDVREGMESMKIQNWSKMDIDREAWKRTVQQAKIHRFVSPKCPDQPWGPLSLQFNGYTGFSQGRQG